MKINTYTFFMILFLIISLPFLLLLNLSTNFIFSFFEYSFLSFAIVSIIWMSFVFFFDIFKEWMKHATDTLFFISDYDFEKTLDKVNRKLSEIIDIYLLLYSLQEDIFKYIKVGNVGCLIPNENRDKYYYLELETLDDFLDIKKRDALISVNLEHIIFSVLMNAENNILIKEVLEKKLEKQENSELNEVIFLMELLNVEVMVAGIYKNKISGILLLSKKRSGDTFKSKDFKLLKFLVNQGSLVLMRIFEIEEKTKIFIENKMFIQHEKELSKKNYELQKTLIELKSAQEKLIEEEQLSAMGKLSGEVAHDIRNPLSSMNRLFAYLKQEDIFNKNEQIVIKLYKNIEAMPLENKDYFLNNFKYLLLNNKEVRTTIDETIQINHKLRKIADDFLDYSKTSKSIPVEKISIKPIIDNIVSQNLKTKEVAENNVKIDILNIDDVKILMFEHQFQKIFFNILDNAIKAVIDNSTDHKLVVVSVNRTVIDSIDMLCLSVKDNGIGISENNLSSIFKPFYTKRTNLMGTGLGLAIVKKIIEDRKGQITVDSKVGEGSNFKIFLPWYK
jgi:signal transduction histidine kinase